MRQSWAFMFLAIVLIGGMTSFAQPAESPTLETVVIVDETVMPSEYTTSEVPVTDESEADEEEDEEEIPSTHEPHLLSTSMDFTATIGENVTLPCEVDDLGDFVLLWNVEKKTDKKSQLLFAGSLSIFKQHRYLLSGTSLNVLNVSKEDSGIYICQLGTLPPVQINHTLDVLYPPTVMAHSNITFITAKEGESITLTCDADGNPTPIVRWKHDGRHYDSMGISSYTINNAQKQNSGVYQCIADNQVGEPASASITVEIVAAPKITTDPQDGLLVVKEGEPISIGCKATGDPTPEITWRMPQHSEMTMRSVQKEPLIRVAKASLMDAGAYECIANNSLGISTSALVRVQVLYAPKVEMKHGRIHAREGVRVNITCVAEGEPYPTVSWRKDGQPLTLPPEYLHVRGTSHYIIFHQLREENFGLYECVASNSLSSAAGTTLLVGTPEVPSITSKPHGSQGTKYTVSWTVNSHTSIDEFSLDYRKVGAEEGWKSQSVLVDAVQEGGVHMQMFQLSDLEAATQYEVTVKAKNKLGWSEPSEPFLFTTKSEENHSDTLSSGSCILNASLSLLFLLLALCTQ